MQFLFLFFFVTFFCDLEQSAIQLFKELSNPALDLSRALQHNRIVVLTLMTAPPAVAEPPVGHQEECVGWWGGWVGLQRDEEREVTDRERETDRHTETERACLCDTPSLMWNNQGRGSEGGHRNS